MTTNELTIIDQKIKELIKDENDYSFTVLKEKIEQILKEVDIFSIDGKLDTKAIDLYLKNVITQRNNIKKEQEKINIDNSTQTKYKLIEAICKKYEFKSQEELINKISELEKKTNIELNQINNSI